MKNPGQLLPLLLLGGFFYLLVLRPAQRRQRAAAELQRELLPGVQVMTTGGLYGTVVAIQDDRVSLEIAPGTVVEFAKGALGKILPVETEPAEPERPPEDSAGDPALS